MIGETISHYKILEKIGEGGMAHVYKAEDTKLKRSIALKFISPQKLGSEETKTRFIQEAQTAAGLNHPNINTIYEINEIENKTFIAMEYIEGTTLRDLIGMSSLNVGKSLDIVCQMAEGLQEAHENRVIHRDIKSSNIMVTPKGQVKIMDFGLVKLEGATKITKTTMVMGTVSYMSPEQACGETIDFRSDIWSVGVVLYEMLTGRLPFQGANDQVILYAIQNKKHEPMSTYRSNLPYLFENIVDRCLQKKLKERYQSVADLRLDLERLKREITSDHATLSMQVRGIPRLIRKPFFRKGAPISIVVLALLATILFTPVPQILKDWILPQKTPEQKGLVVIPFKIVGGQQDEIEYCAGLMEYLSSKLTTISLIDETFWMIPSRDVVEKDIRSASEAHEIFNSINLVLDISLQVIDAKRCLIINLVDPEILRQKDSAILDYDTNGLADSLVKHSIAMLGIEMTPQIQAEMTKGSTDNQEASNFYLSARGYLQRYEKEENLDLAIELFNRSIDNDPDYALAYAGLGEAYWQKWELTKEIESAQKAQEYGQIAVQKNEDLAPVHITLGIIYRDTGHNEEAINELKRAIEIEPDNPQSYRELGRTYQNLGEMDVAEESYNIAINLQPNYWGGYNQLGYFYRSSGQFEQAAKMFQKVTELTPDNFRGYYNLGGMYLTLGRFNLAELTLKKALAIQLNGSAFNNLATVYFFQKKFTEAVSTYEEALEYSGKNHIIWGNLADSRRYSKEHSEAQIRSDYQKAKKLVQEELNINPTDSSDRTHFAYYCAALGELENASKVIDDVLLSKPKDVEILKKAIQIFDIIGDRDNALQVLEEYLKNGGDLDYLLMDPDLADFQKDPRFKSITNEVKLNNK